jgi:hypothetical protein
MRGLVGLIAANVTLIVAVMVYMGWAYESAFFGHFHLSPLDLGLSVEDYLLVSLSLFKPVVVVAVVGVIAVAVAATRSEDLASAAAAVFNQATVRIRTAPELEWLDKLIPHGLVVRLSALKQHWWKPRAIMAGLGTMMTVAALVLYIAAGYVRVSTYLVLALLALGPLLLTWLLRDNQRGRGPYSLAIIVFLVCGLWAGSLYANGLGNRAAHDFTAGLPSKTEVAVYTTQRLALPGIGVEVTQLPSGYLYHYRYEGLRLLYMNAETYYLLPVGWTPQVPLTYILDTRDEMGEMRIELY